MSNPLRIVTWNIHKGVQGFGRNRRLEIHAMQEALRGLDADIICLQEVRSHNDKEAAHFSRWPDSPQAEFLAPPGYASAYRTNAVTRHGEHGNALLARHDMISVLHEDMSDHRLEQRGLLHVELVVNGKPLHVLVVHLGLIAASRKRQMLQLERYMQRHIPAKELLVVAGDFNSPIAPVRWAQSALNLPTQLQPPPLLHALQGHATFPARLPMLQLDHVFVRGARVLHQHVPRGAAAKPWAQMSDHLPLTVELEL